VCPDANDTFGLTTADVSATAAKYQSGQSLATVGEHVGVAADTVGKAQRRAGVVLRPRRGWKY
jgi:hypothetical protein